MYGSSDVTSSVTTKQRFCHASTEALGRCFAPTCALYHLELRPRRRGTCSGRVTTLTRCDPCRFRCKQAPACAVSLCSQLVQSARAVSPCSQLVQLVWLRDPFCSKRQIKMNGPVSSGLAQTSSTLGCVTLPALIISIRQTKNKMEFFWGEKEQILTLAPVIYSRAVLMSQLVLVSRFSSRAAALVDIPAAAVPNTNGF